ncbi:site-specific integrase [Stenotrophomonas muris]|uniref:site-specific integrase n=1 Tax=Stenotrophomonas muris TaxID=2963283 RepID=UPI0021C571BC|nr:site-specific integrase [Stenotrophomonas maltophilia]MCU1132867.1 site-specific integrase [Stenotrophomonas maltophilia]
MNSPAQHYLKSYLSDSTGTLTLTNVRIGRVRIGEMIVSGREAAIHAQEIINDACERARRARLGKNATRYPEPLPVAAPARLLSIEIRDYLADRERMGLTRNTIEATARSLNLLQMACGDIPVSRVDHVHIYRLWELMRWAPPLLQSDPQYRNYTYEQALAQGKALCVQPPAPATVEKHRRFLVTFFGRLEKAKAIAGSPMHFFPEAKKDLVIDPDKAERLFDEEDLRRIFAPNTFIPWAMKAPHRWWVPMIGLYTGARINEVAQLKLADVAQESGVWCIKIQKTVDADLSHRDRNRSRQSLKGKAAVRTIPIPQPLLDAGFLAFVEDIRACGHPRLFPHLSAGVRRDNGDTNARYSQGILNQFSRYMKDLGFPKGIGFHAFRHTIATELHHMGVADEDIALVTGHSISKRVPVLHEAYFHKKPALARMKQIAVLEKYRPDVVLPVYQAGQFKTALSDPRKFYP